jgi:hypothetical protein
LNQADEFTKRRTQGFVQVPGKAAGQPVMTNQANHIR